MRTVISILVALLLAVSSFQLFADIGVVTSDPEEPGHWSIFDFAKTMEAERISKLRHSERITAHNLETETFSYEDGPYPEPNDDGSYFEVHPASKNWGENYVSDIMYEPPNNVGIGHSMEPTGGAGDFTVGSTHETLVGDQNGNGVVEWISYYSYRSWGEDGLDNDGDGCVDEKTYGDWDGQIGCDSNPDQIVYFAEGGLPDSGGKHGTLAVATNWYSSPSPELKIHRIFSMLPWHTFDIPLFAYYPQIVDNEDVISYYGPERENGVNANPEMDTDLNDEFVGSVDARDFPAKDPKNHVCFAGHRLYMGISALRPDGYVVTSFELHEEYDGRDWNGDKDYRDVVAAYYVVDPVDGSCDQGVNGGVYGKYPRTSGSIMTPGYTVEASDDRDWNGDGDLADTVLVWHDIDTTWHLVGHRYTSYTFTHAPGSFGFGYWGYYSDEPQFQSWPLRFGGAYHKLVGAMEGYYLTYFFLTSDEDGDPQTALPEHYVGHGSPGGTLVRSCIQVYAREGHLQLAGIKLIGGLADGNGDGDTDDTLNYIYCPNEEGGGGEFWEEPTSKYSKGLYEDPIPFIWVGNFYYCSAGDVNGYAVSPSFYHEYDISDDADGNLIIESDTQYHIQYWLGKADLEIVEAVWIGDPSVQPGGNILGRISLLNIGSVPVVLNEDGLLHTDDNHWIQELHLLDTENENDILEPDEVVDVHFALRIAGGTPIGIQKIHVMVLHGNLFVETYLTLEISLKMESRDLACYRHRQNAIRAIRSFDMDDDWGMLHDLEPGGYVDLSDEGLEMVVPEDAVILMISWYSNGCRARINGVAAAHSLGMMLTTKYGMGIDFWGFAPGQEEGNEGNGNGGLTGHSRKDVYGF